MKRNWSVVRSVLEQVEAGTIDRFVRERQFLNDPECASKEVFLGHVEILIDAGILKHCSVERGTSGKFEFHDFRGAYITMHGHDLLDALRDEPIWNRIVQKAEKGGVMISWEFIKAAIPIVMSEIL